MFFQVISFLVYTLFLSGVGAWGGIRGWGLGKQKQVIKVISLVLKWRKSVQLYPCQAKFAADDIFFFFFLSFFSEINKYWHLM